jgi:ATP-dependent protease ClpP protease subunit
MPELPKTIYVTFAGAIDQHSLPRIFQNFAAATQAGASTMHLLFQSTGGTVGDGISLYNFFLEVPIELHIYNTGSVNSVAVLAYLAGKRRYVSRYGSFMVHKTYYPAHPTANAARFQAVAETLAQEDARIEAILRAHTSIPREKWDRYGAVDVLFDSQEAVKCGLAHEIREFQMSSGNLVFNM